MRYIRSFHILLCTNSSSRRNLFPSPGLSAQFENCRTYRSSPHTHVHMHIHPYIFCSVRTLVCGEHYTFLSFFLPGFLTSQICMWTQIIPYHSQAASSSNVHLHQPEWTCSPAWRKLYTYYNCHVQKASHENRHTNCVARTASQVHESIVY